MADYETFEGAHPSIRVNVLRELPLSRWLAALRRRLAIIESGTALKAVDSTETGNKYTICTWGMCGEEREAWPDARDHIWPLQFEEEGRVAPLRTPEGQRCPMDRRPNVADKDGNGCFYSCRIFQSKTKDRPTREAAIELYQLRIAAVERAAATIPTTSGNEAEGSSEVTQ